MARFEFVIASQKLNCFVAALLAMTFERMAAIQHHDADATPSRTPLEGGVKVGVMARAKDVSICNFDPEP